MLGSPNSSKQLQSKAHFFCPKTRACSSRRVNDFVFLCVVVGQNQSSTATSGFLDGFSSAHSRVTGRLPFSPGWHFVGTHPSLRAGKTALKKCVEASTSFRVFATILPSSLYAAIQTTYNSSVVLAQREVSRATLYHPISSQTDHWQV